MPLVASWELLSIDDLGEDGWDPDKRLVDIHAVAETNGGPLRLVRITMSLTDVQVAGLRERHGL